MNGFGNVNCLIETGCLIPLIHFMFSTLSYCSHAAWENKGIVLLFSDSLGMFLSLYFLSL